MVGELVYWDSLFEKLIEMSRPRKHDFKHYYNEYHDGSFVAIERLGTSLGVIFDRYSFKVAEVGTVEYRVNIDGNNIQVLDPIISDSTGHVFVSSALDPKIKDIMRRCLFLATDEFSKIWYE